MGLSFGLNSRFLLFSPSSFFCRRAIGSSLWSRALVGIGALLSSVIVAIVQLPIGLCPGMRGGSSSTVAILRMPFLPVDDITRTSRRCVRVRMCTFVCSPSGVMVSPLGPVIHSNAVSRSTAMRSVPVASFLGSCRSCCCMGSYFNLGSSSLFSRASLLLMVRRIIHSAYSVLVLPSILSDSNAASCGSSMMGILGSFMRPNRAIVNSSYYFTLQETYENQNQKGDKETCPCGAFHDAMAAQSNSIF
mmetsp:Transcript_43763/g.105547  ORF Transcript_43763/g.105547 Transcript_43763/m.105547 type:complete len:247 (-) Transcript_43763:110-850(-)